MAVLFASTPSIYDELPGCQVYDKVRNAKSFPGGMPIVAHPPCAQWGRLKHFARKDPAEKDLAVWAVHQLREWGGVLEHPVGSGLWHDQGLPRPGDRDEHGGFTLAVDQSWFGHRARKPTLLYVVGIEPRDIPAPHFSMDPPKAVIETELRGQARALPAVTYKERFATPRPFAEWLLTLARLTSMELSAL